MLLHTFQVAGDKGNVPIIGEENDIFQDMMTKISDVAFEKLHLRP